MSLKRIFVIMTVLVVSVGFAGTTLAENPSGVFTASPLLGGYYFAEDQQLDDNPNFHWGLGLGYNYDQNWGVEALFNYASTESMMGAGDVTMMLYRVDALYHFLPEEQVVPYLALGVGAITFDPDMGSSDTSYLINYGGGIKYFLNNMLALRGDVRHVMSFDDTEHNYMFSFGAVIFFEG